jgi:hypothetical protein
MGEADGSVRIQTRDRGAKDLQRKVSCWVTEGIGRNEVEASG